jgi:hypothetical protein
LFVSKKKKRERKKKVDINKKEKGEKTLSTIEK